MDISEKKKRVPHARAMMQPVRSFGRRVWIEIRAAKPFSPLIKCIIPGIRSPRPRVMKRGISEFRFWHPRLYYAHVGGYIFQEATVKKHYPRIIGTRMHCRTLLTSLIA